MIESGSYSQLSVLLIGMGIIALTTIGTVALVLVGSPWAFRLLIGMVGVTFLLALARPIDLIGVVAVALSCISLIALLVPAASRLVRKLPAASGPPVPAVIVSLLGVSAPLLLGLIPYEPNGWVVVYAVIVPVFAFLYSRTIDGGLALLRFGVPLLALTMAPMMPLPHAIAALGLGATIGVISWSNEVAVAVRPLNERGTTYAIPPVQAPSEILDQAGIDEHGRRK
jgi:hypothetical protein